MFKKYIFKLIRFIVIPLVLFFLCILLTLLFFFNSDINPNISSHNEPSSQISQKNGTISGKFKASDDYLGILSIRFDNKESLNGNSHFRIKNILEDDWYHTATISASQYNTLPFYAFGFPVIEKSKNNTYIFQVKLISGNGGLSVSKEEPVLVSSHVYPKDVLLNDYSLLANFMQNKISYYIDTPESWKVMAVYSMPLIAYLLYFLFERRIQTFTLVRAVKEKLSFILKPSILFIFLCIGIDIFVTRQSSDGVISILTALWLIGAVAYKLEARYSFGVALVFLTFCPFLLTANMDWVAEKSAIWAYMMLVSGTIQSIFEISPVLQKVSTSKPVRSISALLRFVFFTFDQLINIVIAFIKQIIIFSLKYIFKKMPTSISDWIVFVGKILFLLFILVIIFIASIFIIQKTYNIAHIINQKKLRILQNPVIETAEPALVYPAMKVVMYGKNFGWRGSENVLLAKKDEAIITDLWTDTKIIFTVPLHWKPGNIFLWIQKPITWEGKRINTRSEKVHIKLLKNTGKMNADDDAYFEQLKTLSPETLEINGY